MLIFLLVRVFFLKRRSVMKAPERITIAMDEETFAVFKKEDAG